MTEEQQPEPQKGGTIFKFAMMASILIIALIGGLVVYKLVLSPRLAEDAAANTEVEEPVDDKIPMGTVAVQLPQANTSVIMEDPSMPKSILVFQVTLICSNQVTADLVTTNEPWFRNMVLRVHSGRKRAELDDQLVRESIQEDIRIAANQLVARMQDEPSEENKIIAVLHDDFFLNDML